MRPKKFSRLTILLACAACLAHASADASAQKEAQGASALDAVIETERAFARASVEKGTREAFLAFLADDGIVFGPAGPVNGKKSWGERPPRPGVLTWEPIYADVARSGDLGYTIGPWEFRPKSLSDRPAGYGNYVTLWRRQPDNSFKFVLDIGAGNPPPASKLTPLFPRASGVKTRTAPPDVDPETARKSLLELDAGYAADSEKRGAVTAFLAHASDDVRLFREGSQPFVGKAAARAAVEARKEPVAWRPVGADASRAGDLGYVYGTFEIKGAGEGGNYLRIWKRQADGAWRIVLDLMNPRPRRVGNAVGGE